MQHSFLRVAAVSINTVVGKPMQNAAAIVPKAQQAYSQGARVIVFSELTVSGYSCQDLFFSRDLQQECLDALSEITEKTAKIDAVIVLGTVLKHLGNLYNCAVVLHKGKILAVIPKSYLPEYDEFFESRYFTSGLNKIADSIMLLGREIFFTPFVILRHVSSDLRLACEICEDLWAQLSPSVFHSLAGANVVANLSASNDYLGKTLNRKQLIVSHSDKQELAYIYSSSGNGESSMDTVYLGYKAIAEKGEILVEADCGQDIIYADLDLEELSKKKQHTAVTLSLPHYRYIDFAMDIPDYDKVDRYLSENPFIPYGQSLAQSAQEVFRLQKVSLHKRMQAAKLSNMILGLSGGIDSTLTCLVAHELCREYGYSLHVVMMSGFGSSDRTKNNALALAQALGITYSKIDISAICQEQLQLIGHDGRADITFENVQARQRSLILMNMANSQHAIVLGTADLSEIALGFCTYGGDHLSMYNVNAGVPKTLAREIILWWATNNPASQEILRDITCTVISPELLPIVDEHVQSTEDIVGNYVLLDYILYYHITRQFSRDKIKFLLNQVFSNKFSVSEQEKALESYFSRFYKNQFKRSCMPDGPKTTRVSLSPRSSWRMPSDL